MQGRPSRTPRTFSRRPAIGACFDLPCRRREGAFRRFPKAFRQELDARCGRFAQHCRPGRIVPMPVNFAALLILMMIINPASLLAQAPRAGVAVATRRLPKGLEVKVA